MSTILVTNDDGVRSPGLLALKQALSAIAEVMVLAPEGNWSASGHNKTMHKPLRIHEVTLADGSLAHSSSGSPTDCVALALGGALDVIPDLVVAGVNTGLNMGVDVTYSGTVACAMEATIKGVPGIAVSAVSPNRTSLDYGELLEIAGQVACRIASAVLAQGLPSQTLLNVNVPGVKREELRGVHVTRIGSRHYSADELIVRKDPHGQPYYWLGGSGPIDSPDDGTDIGAVHNNYVSVTPVSLDMTDHAFLKELSAWNLTL